MAGDPYRAPSTLEDDPTAPGPKEEQLGARRSTSVRNVVPLAMVVVLGLVAFVTIVLPIADGQDPLLGPCLVATGAIGIVTVMNWRRRCVVDVHEGGLGITRRAGRRVVLFGDVDEVWYELQVNDSSILGRRASVLALRLVEHGGAVEVVPLTVANARVVMERVERACTHPLVADAVAAIDASETLTFAKVRFDREQIAIGGASVAWRELRLMRIQANQVAFFTSLPVIPWKTIGFDEIPHPSLFLRLMRSLAPKVEEDSGFRFG